MAKWTELVGRTVGVIIDAETAMADWTPSHSGRIKKIIVLPGGIAATSLIENGYIKLMSSGFGGVEMFAPFQGIGLETVPRADKHETVSECDLACKETPIHLYYYHNVLPVTPEITVFAVIEG